MAFDPVRNNGPYGAKPEDQTITSDDFKGVTPNIAADLHNLWNSNFNRCSVGAFDFELSPLIADGDVVPVKQWVSNQMFGYDLAGLPNFLLPIDVYPYSIVFRVVSDFSYDGGAPGDICTLSLCVYDDPSLTTATEVIASVDISFDDPTIFDGSGKPIEIKTGAIYDIVTPGDELAAHIGVKLISSTGSFDIIGGKIAAYVNYYPRVKM